MTELNLRNRTWTLGPEFDRGGFGLIHLGTSDSGEEVVIKLIPKDPGADRELLFEEISGKSNVIPILDTGEWQDYWVLVMPKADKSLRARLKEQVEPLSEDDTAVVLIDIATALCDLEDLVVHRDLKPENVLMFEGHWCLTDFGIARYAEATTAPDTRKFSLSTPYAAPEQWRLERATRATDVYALGIIGYELLAGVRPFLGPAEHDFRDQHLNTNAPAAPNCGAALISLLAECMFKAAQARPTPENLLARLQNSLRPGSPAADRLRQANQAVTETDAERDSERSAAQSDAELREGLFQAGTESLTRIVDQMREAVAENAPAATIRDRIFTLSKADLRIEEIRPTRRRGEARYEPKIDVIAHSSINLKIPENNHGYEGRSHSLWYCDAQESGVYRWYETAFMIMPLIPKRARQDPFALDPGDEAFGALSGTMTEYQVARPFTAIDQGKEGNFIEEWMLRFADAAVGNLRHPGSMPEGQPQGSWRK